MGLPVAENGRARSRGPVSGLLSRCSSQVHHHLLLLAPLLPGDLLGSYFLSTFLVLCPVTPSPAGGHGRVNLGRTGGPSQVQSVHCAPAPSGGVADCWNVTKQNVFTLLQLPLPVSVRHGAPVHTPPWQGRTQDHAQLSRRLTGKDNWDFGGGRYVLGKGRRRMTALCAAEVNRQVGFLCYLLLKASFSFLKVRGVCGHEGLDHHPGRRE